MLGFWRRQKTIAVHLVFWPIIAVFVIWGFERYGNPIGGAAAVVNDETISYSQYRNAVQRMSDFYSQIFQGNFTEKMKEQYHLKETALNQLIDTELVSEQAADMGLRPTDAEVRETIITDKNFQKNGSFARENYDAALKYLHMSSAQFEKEERSELVVSKMTHFFEQNLRPSQLEVEKQKLLRSEKKNVEFLKFTRDQLLANLKVAPKDVAEFLSQDQHSKEVKEYFDLHQSEFSKPEEVQARHILIKAAKGNDAEDKAARAKIEKIQSELKTSSFESLATKYTEDPGSKSKGGELNWFGRGRMVPEFEKAAFALEVGQVSEPVRTDYGYHLIKVEGHHAAQKSAFETVKNQIAEKLIAKDRVEKALNDAEKKLGSAPEEAISELSAFLGHNVKWEETGLFSLNDDSIPKLGDGGPTQDKLLEAATEVSEAKKVYPELIHDGSTIYVLRFKAAQVAPVSDDKALAKELATQMSQTTFAAWRSSLRARASIKVNPQIQSGGDTGGGDSPVDM